jgi:uncharacterized protein (DUF305 family)
MKERITMKFRTYALATSAAALLLVLAGCSGMSGDMEGMDHGSDGNTSAPTDSVSAEFNSADETFAMEMIAHHEQAIEMSDMLLAKEGVDARVVELAEAIKAAQDPEIDQMLGFLDAWGLEMPEDMNGMEGMDHSGGMMSDDDMAALEQASGPEASSLFLEQMIQHHQGAIDMAQQQIENGQNPQALELAQKIVDDQTAEIAEMQGLLV